MKVARSRSGLPTVSEAGGGYTNTGSATIVAGPGGEKVRPLFVPSRGYACQEHAVFVARPGMLIIQACRSREGTTVEVSRIEHIGTQGAPDELVLVRVGGRSRGDTDAAVAALNEAMDAAAGKAGCYHCRQAHYVEQS